jgi:uncharacterized protein (TIGR02271 family)
MQHTLVAVFDNRSDAQNAMDELLSSGFSRSDVNVSSATATTGTDTLAGSTSNATHEEGVGASIKHFFTNLFGDDDGGHADRYTGAVTQGNHVLTVTTQSEPEVERAADVIERFGPTDIDERHDISGSASTVDPSILAAGASSGTSVGSSLQSGSTGSSSYAAGSLSTGSQSGSQSASMQRDMGEGLNDQRSAAIPVIQEELKVGKREVERGGVRVFSRVIETPVNESVNLREEHVNVERRPVNQPISTLDTAAFKEQSIELRETAEEAVVQKSARVVEEVVIGKEVTQRQENITDTVRHTDVQVEQLGGSALDDDSYYRNHFTSNYGTTSGNYDEYAPAYSYGTQMRNDARYQGRQWDDVESDLRSDWTTRYGSASGSTWEKMKAAVRHGWDKVAH